MHTYMVANTKFQTPGLVRIIIEMANSNLLAHNY